MIHKNFLIVAIAIMTAFSANAQDARTVLDNMINTVSTGKTYEYKMKQTERINGVNHSNTIFTKVQYSPMKIYLDNLEGANKGTEILYVKGQNDNKVMTNVLWNVSLSPFNSKIRKNQHHTILESGFKLLVKATKDAKTRADNEGRFGDVFSLEGTVTFDGKSCYKMVINDPTFTYVDHTIASGETLYTIAINKNVSEQLIVEKNDDLKSFYSGSEGDVIKIPSSYAMKTVLYIDKSTYYPIYQELHDDKGIFEQYEFTGLVINPAFTDNDFSEDNDDYGF